MANTIKIKTGSGSDPSASDLAVGELALRTDNGKLFSKDAGGSVIELGGGSVADGSITSAKIADGAIVNADINSSAAIAGSKISPSFTSDLTITNSSPKIDFVDAQQNPDFHIQNNNGVFEIVDTTNSQTITKFENAKVTFVRNVDADAGLDVTGTLKIGSNTTIVESNSNNTAVIQHADIHHAIIFRGTTNADGSTISQGNTTTFREYGDFVFRTGNINAQERFIILSDGTCKFVNNVEGSADENMAVFNPNGSVQLYHNNSLKFQTNTNGCRFVGMLAGIDNEKVALGTGNDLQLYHDGNNSIIANTTGNLYILDDNAVILGSNSGTESYFKGVKDGAAELYFNNNKKFETSNTGGTVTGTLVADGFTGPLTGNVTGNASGSSGSCTGNAATATQLANARTIAGVSFNGTANISLNNNAITNGAGYITSVGTSNIADGAVTNAKIDTMAASKLTGALPSIDGSNLTNLPSSGLATSGGTLTGTLNARTILPTANNTYDLGSSSARWRNIYTNDLNLSNKGNKNDIDGTWGSYTIQEGEEDLFLINRRNGKKYKFNLMEVS